ncbi:hypothetical protein FNV43_RR24232 [Rhamnella rubrinervis]|uniref:pectinesterase n=1 Tax=Rhamnella rubrinervis TaxID=2594499 RepID=A0A8K0DLC5_9ROSA|nr:hypothetical protein FNV43_RR24232 [Rhamnella rubrinervis]
MESAHTFASQALSLILLIPFLLFISNTQAVSPASSTQTYKTYIKTACNSTTFPQDCYTSLSPYASKIKSNPQKLCIYALSQALRATKTTFSTVRKLNKTKGLSHFDKDVIQDCLDNINYAIDGLKDSLDTMNNLNETDTEFQLGNVKTWVSAAITDEDTCTDGFEDDDQNASSSLKVMKQQIKKNIVVVARSTSNALALVNHLNYTTNY